MSSTDIVTVATELQRLLNIRDSIVMGPSKDELDAALLEFNTACRAIHPQHVDYTRLDLENRAFRAFVKECRESQAA